MQRVQVTGTIASTSANSSGPTINGEYVLDISGAGDTFADVRKRESYQLSTGALGQAYIPLDAPATIVQALIFSRSGVEIAVRLNGAPAKVTGSGAAFGTIANLDTIVVTIDQGTPVTVTFATSDTTLQAVINRINAAAGAIIASADITGTQLVLTGAKTGGAAAAAAGRQFGSVQVVSGVTSKLGLSVGTTYGAGQDFSVTRRWLSEFPTAGPNTCTKIEVSGSGEIATHFAGN